MVINRVNCVDWTRVEGGRVLDELTDFDRE
jgi:hypothetical protein